MGIHHLPQIDLYWSEKILFQNQLPSIIIKNRFKMICHALHLPIKDYDLESNIENAEIEMKEENDLDDNDESDEEYDPRNKVNFFIEKIISNCKNHWILGKGITIDEAMVPFRGRSSMRFYMPLKPTKWGFKFHSLVESKTSYYYNLIFEPGKLYKELIASEKDDLFTKQIVLSLLTGLENKGHKVFFDSWYASISLAKELNSRGFYFISTLRQNTKNFPEKNLIENSSKHYAFDNKDNHPKLCR